MTQRVDIRRLFGTIFVFKGVVSAFVGFTVGAILVHYAGPKGWLTPPVMSVVTLFSFLGLELVVTGIGVLRARTWGRILIVINGMVGVATGTVLLHVGKVPLAPTIIAMAWYGYTAWYFLRPGVKAQFLRNSNQQ